MADIALIGYGGITRTVLAQLDAAGALDSVGGVLVRPGRAPKDAQVPVVESLEALLAEAPALVAECAGQPAVEAYGETVLRAGIDLMIISIGALADQDLFDRLTAAAASGGARILLPAGAIGGVDALAAMRLGGLDSVTYRSRKPPQAWKGSPAEEMCDLDRLTIAAVLYAGTAREAARRFPKNANVAATVALAGLGLDDTTVELIADPRAPGNIHEIEAAGASGRIHIALEGHPSPDNPRTSALTALSVARALLHRRETIVI